MEIVLTTKKIVWSLRSLHGNVWLLNTHILLLNPQKFMGYWFLQTIIFVRKYLFKYLIAYFFSSMSTPKNISVIYIIIKRHYLTKQKIIVLRNELS